MKALVLCAGFGTRMGELTKNCPKPMLPVARQPIIAHTLSHLSRSGCTDVGMNLHYMADSFMDFCGDGSRWGLRIHYFHEEKPSGTAGAAKFMETLVEGERDFLLLYGDILTNQDFVGLIDKHRATGAAATMVVHRRKISNSIAVLDEAGRVVSFLERPGDQAFDGKESVWVNSGIYVLNRTVLELIPAQTYVDFPKDVFPKLIALGALYGYPLTGYRFAIDSPERLKQAEEALNTYA